MDIDDLGYIKSELREAIVFWQIFTVRGNHNVEIEMNFDSF